MSVFVSRALLGAALVVAGASAVLADAPPPGPPMMMPPYMLRPEAPAGDRLKPGGDGKTLF